MPDKQTIIALELFRENEDAVARSTEMVLSYKETGREGLVAGQEKTLDKLTERRNKFFLPLLKARLPKEDFRSLLEKHDIEDPSAALEKEQNPVTPKESTPKKASKKTPEGPSSKAGEADAK